MRERWGGGGVRGGWGEGGGKLRGLGKIGGRIYTSYDVFASCFWPPNEVDVVHLPPSRGGSLRETSNNNKQPTRTTTKNGRDTTRRIKVSETDLRVHKGVQ